MAKIPWEACESSSMELGLRGWGKSWKVGTVCVEAWGLEITCSVQPSHAGGNGEWIVPILQMENMRHWESIVFSRRERGKAEPLYEPGPVSCLPWRLSGCPLLILSVTFA